MEVALQDQSFTKVCPRCGARLFRDMHICYGCLYDFDHPQPIERPPHELVQEAGPAVPDESDLEPTEKAPRMEPAAVSAAAAPEDAGGADDTLDLSRHEKKEEKASAGAAFTYLVRAQVGELEATVPIGERGVTIGRAPENDIVLHIRSVSRHHLRLTLGTGGVVAQDLGATNPATYEGKPIQGSILLGTGDVFSISGVPFEIGVADGA